MSHCSYVNLQSPADLSCQVLNLLVTLISGPNPAAAAAACCCQVLDSDVSVDIAGLAALALGLVFVSSCKEDVVEAIITALMSRWGVGSRVVGLV